jgi:regulator of RNase E activity RraB
MKLELPDDADGNALRNFVKNGSDLSRPMVINFHIAVPDEESAKKMADVVWKQGYRVAVYASPECSLPWTCECSARMVVTYDALGAFQAELGEISKQFGGHPDGWGSFGNADSKIKKNENGA